MNARSSHLPQQQAAGLLLLLCVTSTALGEEMPPANRSSGDVESIATVEASRGLLEWTPLVDAEGIFLALADPQGQVRTFHFAPGEAVILSLVDARGVLLPDGTHTWELRLTPSRGAGSTPGTLVQSGHFTLVDGTVVPPDLKEPPEARRPPGSAASPRATVAADQIVPDDFIVDGKGCIGLGCVNNEAFGAEALRLKQSVVRLRFEDTSTAPLFPANDWQITVNDPGSGGASKFSIEDLTGAKIPVTIRAGAPDNSLYVSNIGRVGIGTATPGTQLHIYGAATADVFAAMGPDPSPSGNAFNFGYSGASFGPGTGFFNVRPYAGAVDPDPSLFFMTQNVARIIIDRDGNIGFGTNVATFNPADPLIHQPTNARLTGGIWTNGSSRTIKHDIHELSGSDARAALSELKPVSYRPNETPTEVALGFIAEDVPDLLAFNDRKSLSPMDFVAVLTRIVQEQEVMIAELEKRIEQLEAERR